MHVIPAAALYLATTGEVRRALEVWDVALPTTDDRQLTLVCRCDRPALGSRRGRPFLGR